MTCDFADLRDAFFGGMILPDGRILGGGVVTVIRNDTVDTDLAVARFNGVDGRLDTAFGVGGPDGRNGIETTDVPTSVDEVRDLALQDDDGQKKIVVVGRGPVGQSRTFAVARYTEDGKLDAGFADQGIATASFPAGIPAGGENPASAVAVQPADQKIVVGFRSALGNSSGVRDFVLARFTPDGQLDPEFDGDGFVVTDFPDNQLERVEAVLVQPDGKIVAGGRAGPTDTALADRIDFALVRYNPDGSLDNGFGTNGRVRTDFGLRRIEGVVDLVLQPDDKIVAGGTSGLSDVAAAFALARYDSNGGLDHSFGIDGIRTTGLPGQLANMTALILQPGGKLVAVGEGRARAGNDPSDFVVVRYQPNGREDTTFGDDVIDDLGNPGDEGVPDGFKVTHFGPPNSTSTWQGVAIDPQGDIVTVGHQRPDSGDRDGPDFALGRYKASVIPPNLTCQGRTPTVIGTPGDDILVGTPGGDVIHGLEGNDTIIAQGGDDIICGGTGDDLVFGGPGGDAIEGGDGIDQLVGDEPFAGAEGADTLRGGEGDDRLFGFGGDDVLEGDAGADELIGGSGDDGLNGGLGDDRVFGEEGGDTLAGDAGNDTLIGDELSAGTGGPDVLRGGEGDDRLFGAAGDDQLFGDAGGDELDGGPGNDELDGGPGDDGRLFGGSGNDTIRGGPGRFKDKLAGDAGRDVLRGGPGDDRLFGGPGRDKLFGEAGNDQIDGQGGSDSGVGGSGRRDQCFSLAPRGGCENIDVGSPATRPPLPVTPGSSPVPPVCNFPQCGA
ncbi:MAG: hypothetical protein H0U97_19265 [Gammaproteobacteria bacterium]|nr:hypothetical protein [Gammaproteobacteria bacterium]